MQNAADSAVTAAAFNGTSSYQNEAKAVAADTGRRRVDGVSVTALNNQSARTERRIVTKSRFAQSSCPILFPSHGNFSPTLAGAAMAGGSQTHSYLPPRPGQQRRRHRDPDEWRPFADLKQTAA